MRMLLALTNDQYMYMGLAGLAIAVFGIVFAIIKGKQAVDSRQENYIDAMMNADREHMKFVPIVFKKAAVGNVIDAIKVVHEIVNLFIDREALRNHIWEMEKAILKDDVHDEVRLKALTNHFKDLGFTLVREPAKVV